MATAADLYPQRESALTVEHSTNNTKKQNMIKTFTRLIANELHLNEHAVENTLKLLDEGCTIPFISRYRKERTGGLDEVQITAISDRAERLRETAKRKDTIVAR